MMSFWIFAILMVVIALCYVLPPLFQRAEAWDDERELSNASIYRDQFDELERDLRDGVLDKEQYEQGRLELQRRLLEDVSPAEGVSATTIGSARSGRSTAIILGGAIPLLAVILYFQITPRPISTGRPVAPSMQEEEATTTSAAGQPGAPTQQDSL